MSQYLDPTGKDIPALLLNAPSVEAVRQQLERWRELLQILAGYRGDPLDQALTVRAGQKAGFIDKFGNYSGTGGSTIIINPGGGSTGTTPYVPDLTPPPSPANLRATAGLTSVIVEWDAPTYTVGHGHQATRIYAVKKDVSDPTLPTFMDAHLVDEATQFLTISALPSEPATRWHVWAKFVTNDGVESVSPAGGTNGIQVTTGQDVTKLLQALTGQITYSQLFTDLSTPLGSLGAQQDAAAAAALTNTLTAFKFNQQSASDLLAEARDRGTAITEVRNLVETGDQQLAQSIQTLTTSTASSAAAVQLALTALTDADGAEAAARQLLAAQVNDATTGLPATYAALQTEAGVRAGADGQLFAQYTVKIDLNGYVVGYGLAATGGTATPQSAFIVRANQFAIAPPTDFAQEAAPTATTVGQLWFQPSTGAWRYWDGSAWVTFSNPLPFIVQASPTTINGVAVPAGMYANDAYIANGTITNAKIGNLAVDDAKVSSMSVAKLIAGSLQVGAYAQSTGFSAGSTGWRIDGSGNAEFNVVTMRGTVYAGAGLIGGVVIGSSGLYSSNYVPDTSGFRINADGSVDLGNANVRGTIKAIGGNIGGLVVDSAGIRSSNFVGGPGGAGFQAKNDGTAEFSNVTIRNGLVVGAAINNPTLDAFSATVPLGNLTVSVGFGDQLYGNRQAAPSGGKPPYTYRWLIQDGYYNVYISAGINSATATFHGQAQNVTLTRNILCIVTDANGRTTVTSFVLSATHADNPSNPGGGTSDGP